MKTLTTLILMCLTAIVFAQTPCDDLLKKAKLAHEKGEYSDAFTKYRAVKLCNPAKSAEMDKLIEQVFADVDNERVKAEVERDKNQRIINSLYFYKDNYGLGYKNEKYGFIDKNGEVRLDFQYENASAFDINGYSNITIKNRKYKLDTLGNLYLFADNVTEITSDIEFIELKGRLDSIPEKIWECKNLKKLQIVNADNKIENISEKITNLLVLEDFTIFSKSLKKLPKGLTKLKNLQMLNLGQLSKIFVPSNILVRQDTSFVFQEDTISYKENIEIIRQLCSLEYLDISSSKCNTGVLVQLLMNKPLLKRLNASDNNIRALDWLHLVPTLQVLDLSDNKVNNIGAEFQKLSSLKELLLVGNNIATIEKDAFAYNNKLANLNLSNNKLTNLSLTAQSIKYLNVSANGIKNINGLNLPNILQLDLERCDLVGDLDINFTKFINLINLDLSGNKIAKINFQGVSNVRDLDLSDNPLVVIDAKSTTFSYLEKLNLSETNIVEIPHWLAGVAHLTELSLAKLSQLTNLSLLARLKNLMSLDISETKAVKDNMGLLYELNNLRALNISSNKLISLPNNISKLKKLKKLDISNNNLNNLPNSIHELNLVELDLSTNKFSQIPDGILKIKTLKTLNLSSNQITQIRIAASWENLTELNLSDNGMVNFLADSLFMPRLSWLNLMNNPLKEFSNKIFNMPSLIYLNLSNTQLTAFPYAFSQCYSLQSLDLYGNQIATMPSWIQNLQNLELLDLTNNALIDLPTELSNCFKMKTLSLSGNPLTECPAVISRLINLQYLHLDGTKLSKIPQYLASLQSLKRLEISSTPIASNQIQKILQIQLPQTEIIIK